MYPTEPTISRKVWLLSVVISAWKAHINAIDSGASHLPWMMDDELDMLSMVDRWYHELVSRWPSKNAFLVGQVEGKDGNS